MAQAQFPEPKALNVLEIGHEDITANPGTYSLDKPHPGYGKDPRIINQLGHTSYPKWVYPNGNQNPGKIVQNEKEEKEALSIQEVKPVELKDDGPTVQEYVYVAAGYKASTYPPQGYKSKSTDEEVKALTDKEITDPWK